MLDVHGICRLCARCASGGSDQYFRVSGIVVVGSDLYTVNGLQPGSLSPTAVPTTVGPTTARPSLTPTTVPSLVPTAAAPGQPYAPTLAPTMVPTTAPTLAPNVADSWGKDLPLRR